MPIIRVPLILETSLAVVHRMDFTGNANDFDEVFREPKVYTDTSTRIVRRAEQKPIEVPCQVETYEADRLEQEFPGNAPSSNMVLVMHRQKLETLNLLDATTGEVLIRPNDRVSQIKSKKGKRVRSLGPGGAGLYVHEVRPGSAGFGPDGHDLELVFLNDREQAR